MKQVSVTNFKNQALRLLDQVARTGDDLILTRHGKPLVHVEAVRPEEGVVLGRLKGSMALEDDIVQPLGEGDWDACQ